MNIAINTNAVTDPRTYKMWGDWWVYIHLAKEFKLLGHQIVNHKAAEINLDLFGSNDSMKKRFPSKGPRFCWVYSHPKAMRPEIVNDYKAIFCASKLFIPRLKQMGAQHVFYLPKCTHIKPTKPLIKYDVAFCGNTKSYRGENSLYGRPIIDHLNPLKNKFNLALYGIRWERFPSASTYHKGRFYDNNKLASLYGSATVCLNDCAPDMRKFGFVPVRIYDILASGSICISCKIRGLSDVFPGIVEIYTLPEELPAIVSKYLNNDKLRDSQIAKGIKVIKGHTYAARVKTIMNKIQKVRNIK